MLKLFNVRIIILIQLTLTFFHFLVMTVAKGFLTEPTHKPFIIEFHPFLSKKLFELFRKRHESHPKYSVRQML